MIKGIIFDMDGVISDTQKIHSRVESKLLSNNGINISPEKITLKYSGVRTSDFFKELLKNKSDNKIQELMKEKWNEMEKQANLSIDPIPGVLELIQKLKNNNYILAIASASYSKYVKNVLKNLNIIDYFSYIVSGDMVLKGKPDPESFLLAASKINIKPEECLVIEDGINGMKAASAANMKCIGLVKDKTKKYPTKNLISSLSKITLEYIKRLK